MNIIYSYTRHLYNQWLNSLIYSATIHGSARRYLMPFRQHFDTVLMLVFVSRMLEGVMSFLSHQQRKKCM